jgi:hypothetical protein
MRVLADSPYFLITLDETHRLVRLTRTPKRFHSLGDVDEVIAMFHVLDPYRRGSYALLMDARQGPLRSDPALEPSIRRMREAMSRGFPHRAVLLASAVGEAQSRRIGGGGDIDYGIFFDEKEALHYLAAALGRRA